MIFNKRRPNRLSAESRKTCQGWKLSLSCIALTKPKVEETWLEYKREHEWKWNDKSNYDGAYWQGRAKAHCFSVTMFGDDFRWWIWWITKRVPFSGELGRRLLVYAQGCPCQMGVVDWEFDRHPHMFLITTVVEVFPGTFEPGYEGSAFIDFA